MSSQLCHACTNGDAKAVGRLLERRADPNAPGAVLGFLPLWEAARVGHEECVRLLLAAHADPTHTEPSGGSLPIVGAAVNGHAGVVRQLVAARADPRQPTGKGSVALVAAAGAGHEEAVRALIEVRADLSQRADSMHYKCNALEAAIVRRHTKIVVLLAASQAEGAVGEEAHEPTGASASGDAGGEAPMELSLANSHFRGLYETTAVPKRQHELFAALDRFLRLAGAKASIAEKELDAFYSELEHEAIEATLMKGRLSEVQAIATRLWSSAEQVGGREFCSLLNHAIRTDDEELLPSATIIVRAVNELCVHRRKDPVRWPEDHVTYRGGGLPDGHQRFFEPGKKYRVPMFLATSFQLKMAKSRFARTAQVNGLPPVVYIVHLDKDYGCMHVNYLGDGSVIDDEDEFLFAPYSTFEVLATRWRPSPTWMEPHEVELKAAVDNMLEPENLPLAPWH